MRVTRIILNGVPYKLTYIDEDIVVDDYCDLCALHRVCMREDSDENIPRYLCDMDCKEHHTAFVVDTDIDKTIRQVLNDSF